MARNLYEIHFFGFFAYPKHKIEWEDFKSRASRFSSAQFEFLPPKDLFHKIGNPFVMIYKIKLDSKGEKIMESRKIGRQINIRERRIVKCVAAWFEVQEEIFLY